jgi:hypothetical protein
VRHLIPISAFFVLALAAGACTDEGESSSPSTTAPNTTSPFEIVVTEDRIAVGLQEGVFGPDGQLLVTYTSDEQACIGAAAADAPGLAGAAIVPPGTLPDPDMEQTVAEVVIGCVALDRFSGVIADQLAQQPALEGVDRACLEREVASLQDTPDVLAAVLRGDQDAIPVIAGTAAENCS